jgi:hypothetical protein
MATRVAAAGGGNFTAGGTWVGGIAPTAADDAQLNATSGAVTIDTGSVCRSLDCTGYATTLTHTSGVTLTIGDGTAGLSNIALKLVAGMTYTLGGSTTSAITFVSTSATTQTVDQGGKTCGNMTYQGAASSYQLTSASTVSGGATVTLSAGTLDTNGQTCTWGKFGTGGSSGVAKTLTLGASSISLILVTGTLWDATVGNNLVLNAGTSNLTISGQTGAYQFSGNGLTYNNLTSTSNQQFTLTGANTFNNFALQPSTGGSEPNLIMPISVTNTVTGTLTLINSDTAASASRISCYAGGVFPGTNTNSTIIAANVNLANVTFMNITAGGTASPWTGISLGDGGGTTGITFPTGKTMYWVLAAGGAWSNPAAWATSSGGRPGANHVPLAQDNVIFDAKSIKGVGKAITANMRILGKDIDFSAVTFKPSLGIGTFNPGINGSLTLSAGMTTTVTLPATLTFVGRGNHTITTAGVGIVWRTAFGGYGGTYTLQDDYTQVQGSSPTNFADMTQTGGTLSLNNFNVTTAIFSSSNSNTRTINMGSGTITLVGVGTVWSTSTTTNLTLNAQTSTILIAETDGANKTLLEGD